MSIVTLAEARQALNYDADDVSDDAELQLYVDAITGTVENYKNEVIELVTITEEHELEGLPVFYLRHVPVVQLMSITPLDELSFAPPVTQLHVTSDFGRVRVLASGYPPYGLCSIGIQAGYSTVPPRYKRGALVILQHVWETQRGASITMTGLVGAEELRERGTPTTFSIPRKALEWLGPPRQVAG